MVSKYKKVVVFGGSGFIGSHVVDRLIEIGYSVTVFDLVKGKHLNPKASFFEGNIMNKEQISSVLSGVDIVYNFAGLMSIEECSLDAHRAMSINVIGNINILQSVVENKINKYIYASSIYVNTNKGSFYRISKYSSELVIREYARLYGLDFTILRCGSVYGPRSDERNGINRFVKAAFNNEDVVHYGTEEDRRRFVHIDDLVTASISALDEGFSGKTVNILGPRDFKVIDVIRMIIDKFQSKSKIVVLSNERGLNYKDEVSDRYAFEPGSELVFDSMNEIDGYLDSLKRND